MGDYYRPSNQRARPQKPQSQHHAGQMYQFGGSTRTQPEFSFRSRIAERDLLTHVPSSIETPLLASNHTSHKFRDLENLTDSDEADMDEGSSGGDDNAAEGRVKRRRIDNDGPEPISKWSNPDPYTALPPPAETTGKHIDVVKLIRKARNEATQQATEANQEDFISFEALGDDIFAAPANAPLGPKSETSLFQAPDLDGSVSRRDKPKLGKRKRAEYEDDDLITVGRRGMFYANAAVLTEWRSTQDVSSAPWLRTPNAEDSSMVSLHKEILDFYAWVRPQDYEFSVREDLISRLSRELRRWKDGTLASFGSYAAGLYLPIGDMDLVFTTRTPSFMSPSQMYNVGRFIDRSGIARPGSLLVIAKARVPIIKFVDHITGLKVDLSFNNSTGTVAIATFRRWQAAYPAVPVLVAVVKQLLMIRGLNDNATGGIGGFAIICLVTSLVQTLPTSQIKSANLGEMLVEFFNLYGNIFDTTKTGIRLEPPGYVDKRKYPPLAHSNEKLDRLMIIDPNQPDNNITGGSKEIPRILKLFSQSHELLQQRLDEFSRSRKEACTDFSFLEQLVGGDFTAYNDQRQALHAVHLQMTAGSGEQRPPPRPMMTNPALSTKKAIPKDSVEDMSQQRENQQPKSKGQRRVDRLKRLRPDLLPELTKRKSLSAEDMRQLGGYKTTERMWADLDTRDAAQQKSNRKMSA